MTALILMLTLLPHILPAMSELPQPVNVVLNSSHFSHVLKWAPGPGTPPGAYYHVTVKTQTGISEVPVAGCEHVQHPLVCNMTEAFPVLKEVYFTQIKALLEEQESQQFVLEGFKPITDTHLDLPLLTVAPCGEDLCVDLEPPKEHLREFYDSLQYTLRIKSNNADKAQFKNTRSLRREILKDPVSGRQYCVSICFSDSEASRKSNYSKPVCAVLPGHYTADPWISAILCLLVTSGVVVGALLVYTGTICLMRKPLPPVLTSIRHIEEALVISRSMSLSSFLDVKPTPPSSGEKGMNQTDESDGESVTETSGGSREGGYNLRRVSDPFSSSSSSSSSLSAPLFPQPKSPSLSSNQTSDILNPQPELLMLTEKHSNAVLMDPLMRTRTASHSSQCSDPCPADVDGLTVGRIQPKKEEKVVGEEDGQDVNLLTLTFGGIGEGEDEKEPESTSASEVYNTIPTLPSQTRDTKEVAIETVSCSVDEEEEEELSGYIGRL